MIYVVNGSIVSSNNISGIRIINGSLFSFPDEGGGIVVKSTPFILTFNIFAGVPALGLTLIVNPIVINFTLNAPSVRLISIKDVDTLYKLVLTGAENGTADLELPIKSFSASVQQDKSSYLTAIIPSLYDPDEILNRMDGHLKIDMVYVKDGLILQRETIIETDFTKLSMYSQSTSDDYLIISGKRLTKINSAKEVVLSNYTEKTITDGKYSYTFAEPDIFLRPGDTVRVGNITFVAGNINYYIDTLMRYMQVVEV